MLSTVAIAFSMSTDAFAASLGKGAALERPSVAEILRTGFVFGTVEAITPLVGWAIGIAAAAYVQEIDHWIAFGLLAIIGLRMVWQGLTREDSAERASRHSVGVLVSTALATSIDALAVGVTLSFLNADIVITALTIGAATFCMTCLGATIGRFAGARLGRSAEILGGIVLIGVGTTILVEHLGLHAWVA